MIDIKTLNIYSRFINLKQICVLSGVNYNSIHSKLRNHRLKKNTSLNPNESFRIAEGLKKIGVNKILRNIQN